MSEQLTVLLSRSVQERLNGALKRAQTNELGGVLMAEHQSVNRFVVHEITVHKRGTFARFVRHMEEALQGLGAFFKRHENNFSRFNYLGEWHSHPSFSVEPSSIDDASMKEIINDTSVGAHFVVLLIVKLSSNRTIEARAYYYLPDGPRYQVNLQLE